MQLKWTSEFEAHQNNIQPPLLNQPSQTQQQHPQQVPQRQLQHAMNMLPQVPFYASQTQAANGSRNDVNRYLPNNRTSQDDPMNGFGYHSPRNEIDRHAVNSPHPPLHPPPPLPPQPALPYPHLPSKMQNQRWSLTPESFQEFPAGGEPMIYESLTNGTTHYPSQTTLPHMRPPTLLPPMPTELPPPPIPEIAPSAKKLWGVEEPKEDGPKGILNMNGGDMQCGSVWRDATWSSSGEHSMSQPMTMVTRRQGNFQTNEGSILSPRSSEAAGLGVKMVEFVLGPSPVSKELEPNIRSLALNNPADGPSNEMIKKEDKHPSYDQSNKKKELENGNANVQQNGAIGKIQNGLDDDKSFNRTPGSRQPSPEDEINKNLNNTGGGGPSGNILTNQLINNHNNNNNILVVENMHGHQPLQSHQSMVNHHAMQMPISYHQQPPPHHQVTHMDTMNHYSQEQLMGLDPSAYDPHQANNHQSMGHPHPAMDSSNMVQTSFDPQQLFRTQQQQQQQQAAAVAAVAASTPTQLQLLQQQQYFQHQQQQLAAAAVASIAPTAFAAAPTQAPYVYNGQDYLVSSPHVMSQYFGVPWGLYPANLIQQGATTNSQPRRPLTPSSAATESANNLAAAVQTGQYQVIPYYDQNCSLVMRPHLNNPPAVRLVSPAQVLVNPTNTNSNGVRLLNSQAQQIGTSPSSVYSNAQNNASIYNTPTPSGSINGLSDVSLGMNGTARRDSFDRNTSTFSPSIDYTRPKWPQTHQAYAPIGAPVTACQSPLGLTSGSPPPGLAAAAGLQLGPLMTGNTNAGRGILSAAPVCTPVIEGLTANGTLLGAPGNAGNSSLFAKLGGVRGLSSTIPGATIAIDKQPSNRSRLLEEFRNSRFPNLQLRDIQGHIVEFSQDQHGSRFIQQKLERASIADKQLVFMEILPSAHSLMTDVFGNYVIQKFFEYGTPEQKQTLAQTIRGNVLPLALQMYGCRVIQKALESVSTEQQVEIVRELDGHVLKCIKDQNGNHVVQKCIECVDPHSLHFIIDAFRGQVFHLSTHPYGCRVIQRVLEHCLPEQTATILEEMHQNTDQLIQDQYGNYVIQHVLEHGKAEDKSILILAIAGKILTLSQHKFASNVVEKCVTHGSRLERNMLIDEVCSFNESGLHTMMKDQYANYVVQKMLDVCEPNQRKILMNKIRPHFSSLKKFTYGKHIIAKLEKYFSKSISSPLGSDQLSVIGTVSTNGVM